MATGPIALITDFGTMDPFIGIMKGVILGINPGACTVDLCNEIRPGDIRNAAFALRMSLPYFPEGTVFLAVVDPGVGSTRRALAAQIDGKTVVGPDNGILTWVLHEHPDAKVVELTNRQYFLPEVSGTFHGRDVFAPVAAHLSKGVSLDEVGSRVTDAITFEIPQVIAGDRSLQGEVIYVDRFGNLVTNISRERLGEWLEIAGLGSVRIHIGSAEIEGISGAYGDVPKGRSLTIFGSTGFLEVAVNGGSALDVLGAGVGAHILLYRLPQ